MRSKLFVPGSRPAWFDKALAGPADALSIDLEDAVLEEHKAQARAATAAWLGARDRGGKLVVVRVNAPGTPHYEKDVAAVVLPGLDVVNIPKLESADEVRCALSVVRRAELANGVRSPVRLLVNVETPRALREAAAMARADERVMGLQLGLADLFEPLGIDRTQRAAVRQVQLAVRLAAGEAGVPAYDAALADAADGDAFLAEAQEARRLGYAGKTCIHPRQVGLANRVFSPSDEELAWARRVVAAAADAQGLGHGAFQVDGRMVDRPFVRRAEAVLDHARQLGLAPH